MDDVDLPWLVQVRELVVPAEAGRSIRDKAVWSGRLRTASPQSVEFSVG